MRRNSVVSIKLMNALYWRDINNWVSYPATRLLRKTACVQIMSVRRIVIRTEGCFSLSIGVLGETLSGYSPLSSRHQIYKRYCTIENATLVMHVIWTYISRVYAVTRGGGKWYKDSGQQCITGSHGTTVSSITIRRKNNTH